MPYNPQQMPGFRYFVYTTGQMVLFTSPEDMVIGQSLALHRREGTSQSAAAQLKTVPKLVSSSLAYQPDKVRILPYS